MKRIRDFVVKRGQQIVGFACAEFHSFYPPSEVKDSHQSAEERTLLAFPLVDQNEPRLASFSESARDLHANEVVLRQSNVFYESKFFLLAEDIGLLRPFGRSTIVMPLLSSC